MWSEYFWPIISWIYSLKISVVTTYSPRKKRGSKCVAVTTERDTPLSPELPSSPFTASAKIIPHVETSWKWVLVGVFQPVSLQQRSSAAAGEANLTPIHTAPFSLNEDVLWEIEYIWHCIYHSCLLWTELFYRQTHCSLTY